MGEDKIFMMQAIKLAQKSIDELDGGPFAALVVKDGLIVGKGSNSVTKNNDPTAHAEVMAIRDACKNLNNFQLDGCVIYSSCEPCPMCLAAIYWARPDAIYFAASKEDASEVSFDDSFIYQEIAKKVEDRKIPSQQILRNEAKLVFHNWELKKDKVKY